MSDSSPTIIFSDATFSYRSGAPLFEKVNIRLGSGSPGGAIVAIVGNSGVGKSTFCSLACGTLSPTNGIIDNSSVAGRIATVPQKPVIFDSLTVRENMSVMRYSNTIGRTFRDSNIEKLLDVLDLRIDINRKADTGQLSGGEIQRLMLARARAVEPALLVLDEPCSSLDCRSKNGFLRDLKDFVKEQSLLALFISHNWSEVEVTADQIVCLSHSKWGVTQVSSTTVDEVELYPPTVDMMYFAHWPYAVNIQPNSDLSDQLALLPHELDGSIGIFLRRRASAKTCFAGINHLQNLIWNVLSANLPSHPKRDYLDSVLVSGCIFDSNGKFVRPLDESLTIENLP